VPIVNTAVAIFYSAALSIASASTATIDEPDCDRTVDGCARYSGTSPRSSIQLFARAVVASRERIHKRNGSHASLTRVGLSAVIDEVAAKVSSPKYAKRPETNDADGGMLALGAC